MDRLTYGGNGAEPYRRYRLDDGDVSPMAIPGQAGGEHTISGLEHVETGDPTSSSAVHARMNARRHAKLERLASERGPELVRTFGADGLIAESKGHFDAADYQRQLNADVKRE